jgi:hypothetical protein
MAEPVVSLSKIKEVGGPSPNTVNWRINHGKYMGTGMVKIDRKWKIPKTIAIDLVQEWKLKQDLIPIADAARSCGLKSTALNPKAEAGQIDAVLLSGRWFVTPSQLQKLKSYYLDSVTTTAAAHRLGLKDRWSFLCLVRRGFPVAKMGNKRKVLISDIEAYRNGTLAYTESYKSKLVKMSKKLGLNLKWSIPVQEVKIPIRYRIKYVDEDPVAAIYLGDKLVLELAVADLHRVFGDHVYSTRLSLDWAGTVDLMCHSFVEKLVDGGVSA